MKQETVSLNGTPSLYPFFQDVGGNIISILKDQRKFMEKSEKFLKNERTELVEHGKCKNE